MNCKIVYLKPAGAGGYKTALRSDTLWAAICWAIRSVFGESELEEILAAYEGKDPSKAFFLSSAFPYLETDGQKTCFFPPPFLPLKESIVVDTDKMAAEKIKLGVRRRKEHEKQPTFLTKPHFEYSIGNKKEPLEIKTAPSVISRPMTHNTIDRLTGSTRTINKSGQLFHTDEFYLKGENTGLFFLLQGNLDRVIPALRFLNYEGIGGDRSTGKGWFEISEPEDFSLQTPSDPNALMCLSLYHPKLEELRNFPVNQRRLLNYKLEDRLGRTQLQRNYLHDQPLFFFKEGSVFPLPKDAQSPFGQNVITGKHSAGFDIRRYGFGFMVNVKIL